MNTINPFEDDVKQYLDSEGPKLRYESRGFCCKSNVISLKQNNPLTRQGILGYNTLKDISLKERLLKSVTMALRESLILLVLTIKKELLRRGRRSKRRD